MHFFTTSMKYKRKISYLGEKISILPKKVTEQMAVEVDVINGQKSENCALFKMQIFAPKIFYSM